MKSEKLTRRQAFNRLMKLLAVLGGAGGLKPAGLGAQITIQRPDLEYLGGIKAEAARAKAIKILLFPREEIIRAEFGRLPMGFGSPFPGGDKCDFFFDGGTCGDHKCRWMSACGENVCGKQSCPNLNHCTDINSCGKQDPIIAGSGIFSNQVLTGIMNDPFIKALSKAFKVTTAQDLGSELRRLLL